MKMLVLTHITVISLKKTMKTLLIVHGESHILVPFITNMSVSKYIAGY